MNKAKHYLSCIEDESEPNYLMIKTMIKENAMNFEKVSEYWQKALNVKPPFRSKKYFKVIYDPS